jgi:hypothetical protein
LNLSVTAVSLRLARKKLKALSESTATNSSKILSICFFPELEGQPHFMEPMLSRTPLPAPLRTEGGGMVGV